MSNYGIATDYDYNATHKLDRITVWSGLFLSTFEATGIARPKNAARSGYTLTTYNGDKVSVDCPTPRNEANYLAIDKLVSRALNAHYRALMIPVRNATLATALDTNSESDWADFWASDAVGR